MKVCHVTDTFLPKLGGLEITIDALIREMQQQGTDCSLVAPKPFPPPASLPYPVTGYRPMKISRLSAWWLRQAIARNDRLRGPANVYVAHHSYPCGAAVVKHVRQSGRGRSVIHVHGGDIYDRSRWRRKPAIWARLRTALDTADAVIVSSENMLATVADIIGKDRCVGRVHIIPNGIDLDAQTADASSSRFASAPFAGKPFVLGLGRLISRKAFDQLIEAFPLVDGCRPHLVIAGDGPERHRLETRAAQVNGHYPGRIHVVGSVQGADKRWLLQNCAFMAAPSVEESFGIVALEAMACGKPVLGTAGTGLAEVIEEGVNGYLVPVSNKHLLSAMIVAMLTSAEQMRPAARRRAEEFAWPEVTRKYLDLLRSLGGTTPPAPVG